MASRWDAGRVTRRGRLHGIMRLLRIEHTLFSLPFAYAGALLSEYKFSLTDAILMATAVVGLRTAGMSYNNIADLDIDRANPRTRNRPLVLRVVSLREAWSLVIVGTLVFLISAAMLNFYALVFSPLILAITLTYPYAKRIHSLPHLHLGVVLGSVVFGGAIAASGDQVSSIMQALASVPWAYVAGVTLWVAGFDILYSIMDYDFDRRMGLKSIPVLLGPRRAKTASLLTHIASACLFIYSVILYSMGAVGLIFTLAGATLLVAQHYVASNLNNLHLAFNMNLVFPVIISIGVIMDKLRL